MLTRLQIQNYRGIKHLDVPLGQFQVQENSLNQDLQE